MFGRKKCFDKFLKSFKTSAPILTFLAYLCSIEFNNNFAENSYILRSSGAISCVFLSEVGDASRRFNMNCLQNYLEILDVEKKA